MFITSTECTSHSLNPRRIFTCMLAWLCVELGTSAIPCALFGLFPRPPPAAVHAYVHARNSDHACVDQWTFRIVRGHDEPMISTLPSSKPLRELRRTSCFRAPKGAERDDASRQRAGPLLLQFVHCLYLAELDGAAGQNSSTVP
jgi:hypothetical protein